MVLKGGDGGSGSGDGGEWTRMEGVVVLELGGEGGGGDGGGQVGVVMEGVEGVVEGVVMVMEWDGKYEGAGGGVEATWRH